MDILIGNKEEKGFLEIRVNPICIKNNFGPLIDHKNKNDIFYVNHIDSVFVKRAEYAFFFSNYLNFGALPIDGVF